MESRTDLGNGVRRHHPQGGESDGPPVTFPELTARVLTKAADLGFIRAGVASLHPFVEQTIGLKKFLERGYQGSMHYLGTQSQDVLARTDPRHLMPSAQCAVVVALAYQAPEPQRKRLTLRASAIAAYAQGADYHSVIKEKLLLLADAVATLSGRSVEARACVDTAPLFERDLAARAGFLFVGKNTLGIAPGAGSHFLLGELLLDVKLETSAEPVSDGCGSCRACLDACPTQAFVKEGVLDARRCISYLTIESTEDVDEELRPLIGGRVFGCDVCQSVCPYNQSVAGRQSAAELAPLSHLQTPDLSALLSHGSSAHRRFVQGTALRRVTRDQLARNAAVALGNSGSREAIGPLRQAAQDHRSAQVRSHALWALRRLAENHEEAQECIQELERASVGEDTQP